MSDPQKLKEEADKLASSSGGFFSKIFGGGNKLEEACELYTQGEIFYLKSLSEAKLRVKIFLILIFDAKLRFALLALLRTAMFCEF